MRKYGYKRPSATLMVKRRPARRKKPSFFFTLLLGLLLLVGVGFGAFVGGRYFYRVLKEARITDWHVKSVSVSGLAGTREKEIFLRAAAYEGKPFSMTDADQLRRELVAAYPMLTKVSVSRGLLSGKLKISAQPRRPVAQFIRPDQVRMYVDEDSVVYADPQQMQDVLQVSLVGDVADTLAPSFVELVQSLLKLKKSLAFESLEFNVTENTVTLRLPDKSIIRFKEATHLKSKVQRAAQIMVYARGKYEGPVLLDFTFFEKGKVFLTQRAH